MATVFTSNYVDSAISTWVTLVEAPASYKYIVRHYMCINFAGGNCNLDMRITNDSDVEQSRLLNSYVVSNVTPLNVTPAFIVLDPGYKLQVRFDTADANAAAWGGYDA